MPSLSVEPWAKSCACWLKDAPFSVGEGRWKSRLRGSCNERTVSKRPLECTQHTTQRDGTERKNIMVLTRLAIAQERLIEGLRIACACGGDVQQIRNPPRIG